MSRLGSWLAGAVLILFCAVHAVSAGEETPQALKERLAAPIAAPEWLVTTRVPFTPQELTDTNRFGLTIWAKLEGYESQPARFQEAVATVQAVLEANARPQFKAECHQRLGYYYEGMLEDYVRACQSYRSLREAGAQAKQVHDPQNHNSRDTARLAVLGMARCCAATKSPAVWPAR